MKFCRKYLSTTAYILSAILLTACGDSGSPQVPGATLSTPGSNKGTSSVTVSDKKGSRDNTPVCLIPEASGTDCVANDIAVIDYSHADKGYICVQYTGTVEKIKVRITGPDKTDYTYDLHGNDYTVFPLSVGDGTYDVTVFENVSGTRYSTCLHKEVECALSDEFGPFLYPNQYVNFNSNSKVVAKAKELVYSADTDLDAVLNIYNFMISTISYDYDKASDPPKGYTSDVDEILESQTGICLDYAAVMASMLRSQQIPTRLEIGYAKDAYHAWISIYTEETGWLNGIIEISGNAWSLVDPTFGANSSEKALKKFIGDGSNYTLQKMY